MGGGNSPHLGPPIGQLRGAEQRGRSSPRWQQMAEHAVTNVAAKGGGKTLPESGQKDKDSYQDVDQGVLPHPHAQRSPRWSCGPLIMVSPSPPPLPQFLSGLLQLCLHPLSSVPVQIHQQLCLCHLEMPHLGDRGQCVGLGTAVEPHPLSPVSFSPARCGQGASGQGPPGS